MEFISISLQHLQIVLLDLLMNFKAAESSGVHLNVCRECSIVSKKHWSFLSFCDLDPDLNPSYVLTNFNAVCLSTDKDLLLTSLNSAAHAFTVCHVDSRSDIYADVMLHDSKL